MEYTKDKFLTDIKKMNKTNDKYEDKAYESIVKNLFLQGKRGKEKAMGLDEYDSESNSKLTLIPGHIYMFKYVTDTTTKYNDGRVKFEYYDTLPLVLCTGNNKNIIQGINLNLCNYDLRTLILNDIYNLDPNFLIVTLLYRHIKVNYQYHRISVNSFYMRVVRLNCLIILKRNII